MSTITLRSLRFATLIAALGLVLASCGGSDEPTAASTTSEAVTTSSGTVVSIELTEDGNVQGVDADVTTFQVGVPYHFVVTNTGTRSHELMIIEPIEPGTMDMEAMDEMALYVIEEDDLGPKDTVEFDYVFPAEAAGTDLEFACYLTGHYEAGMHLAITVEG